MLTKSEVKRLAEIFRAHAKEISMQAGPGNDKELRVVWRTVQTIGDVLSEFSVGMPDEPAEKKRKR